MITYDDAPEIREMYKEMQFWQFDLVYSVANSGLNSEILFISDENLLPDNNKNIKNKINLRRLH